MTFRLRALTIAFLFGSLALGAPAQTSQPVDFIVAVVNSEPITNSEVRSEVQRASQQLAQLRQPVPAPETLRRLVLERLINDRAQLQVARESGIRIDESSVDQAEQNVARQSQLNVDDLHKRLAREGLDAATFRNQLRDQLLLSRLREREVESRVRVSDVDVERFLADKLANNTDPFAQEINLAHLLITVPEKSSAEQTAALSAQAQKVLGRIRAGEDFAKLVQEVSAADRANAGELGLRSADRYPRAFVLATQKLKVGEVSDLVRSGAGFHILKLLDKRAPTELIQSVVQTRARHILLRTGPELTTAAAAARLAEVRQLIQSGKIDFPGAAKQYSQDGSAAQGGELGWAVAGMFVPEFEEAMGRLADAEISAPVVSRFGVHLIQVQERRLVNLTPREMREAARSQLRETRLAEAFATWARDVRERAFVELRDPPQ